MTAATDILPALRRDVEIFPAAPSASGEPSWTVFDPVTNRFYKIGWAAYQILSRWDVSARRVVERVRTETVLDVTLQSVEDVKNFLIENNLAKSTGLRGSVRNMAKAAAERKPFIERVFEKISGIRIALFDPDAFLKATLPFVRPLFSKGFVYVAALSALAALFLISRQSALFFSTFLYFFDFSGACAYAAAVIFAKAFHEFGHAYAAALFGCRVHSMGVMLIFGCPMFYTDTTDTWRLDSRKKRLIVASAGMGAELMLAIAASFGWLFFADGFMRSACFLLATSGWVMTLGVNLCPLMRFDGYYILSDWWGIENLRERSSKMMRWKIGEVLFGYKAEPPETLPASTQRGMLLYALCSWLYRLGVFFGIALTLYHFAFKLAGMILFAASVLFLIVLPCANVVLTWKRNWNLTDRKGMRVCVFTAILIFAGVLFFAPLSESVTAPAMVKEASETRIYAPFDAQIISVSAKAGQTVKKGEALARLYSLPLAAEYKKNETLIKELNWRLNHGSFLRDAESVQVLQSRLSAAQTARAGFLEQAEKLTVKSEENCVVSEVFDGVRNGAWIAKNAPMFLLTREDGCRLTAFVKEEDAARLNIGAKAVFYPEADGKKSLVGKVTEISQNAISALNDAEPLASIYKGGLPVRVQRDGTAVPAGAYFRTTVGLDVCPNGAGLKTYRGHAVISAVPESLKTKLVRRLRALWVKEGAL